MFPILFATTTLSALITYLFMFIDIATDHKYQWPERCMWVSFACLFVDIFVLRSEERRVGKEY